MNKHEEARVNLNDFILWLEMLYGIKQSGIKEIANIKELFIYFSQAEATEKRLQELERDVKRYFELNECSEYYLTPEEKNEKRLLETKLLKVGNE